MPRANPPRAASGARGLGLARRAAPLLLALVASGMAAGRVSAQQPAVAELHGQVLLENDPLPSAPVVLHRVSTQESGPIDSTRAGPDGGFRFRLRNVPDPSSIQEVWFASVEWAGVSYFSAPIHLAAQLDSVHTIQVFDTTVASPAGAPLRVQARYTLMEEGPGGWLITDLLRVRNEGERTLVAAPGGATWTYPLPTGAADLEVGGSQRSPDAVALEEGMLRVTSPVPPGERELVVRYRIPDPFVTLRYPGPTDSVKLMVREPAPVAVAGLNGGQPVEMEPGVRYRHYTGIGLRDAVVSLTELRPPPELPLAWIAVAIALVLAGAGVLGVLRPHPSVALATAVPPAAALDPRLTPFEQRQLLLLEVARLDEARPSAVGPEEDAWSERRSALLDRVGELETGSASC